MTFIRILVSGTLFVFHPLCLPAQDTIPDPAEPIRLRRITSSIALDGMSNEPAWEGISSLPVRMRNPDYGSEPSDCTQILLGYDDDYLYAAARFYESDPSQIQATSFKRDIWTYTIDQLGLIIDAFNDNENGMIFITTPTGTRTDVNILNDAEGAPMKNMNTSWNTFWDAATLRNDAGWFAEVRIPFSSLRFEENNEQVIMSISAYRWSARKFEMDIFPLVPEKFGLWGAFKPSQTQEVLFEGIKSHNPLYITPYLLGGLGQTYRLNDQETDYERADEFAHEAGLDLKYGLTNNLTLDVTLNPDFAQVEADNQMINLTRYSLFFPEKRLFFQERSGNFEFRFDDMNRLFYSRRIGLHQGNQVRIFGGARVVGRAGPWDLGFLNMQTQKFEELPSENFNVVRFRRQVVNPYSYVGGMVTSRIGNKDNWNTTYGIDGIIRLFGDEYLSMKWAQSFENDLKNNIASLDPSKIYINWNRRSNKGIGYNLSYSRSGKDFNPGIGYERRDNYTRFGDMLQYGWYPGEGSRLHNHQLFIEGSTYMRNTDGHIESSEIGPGWKFATRVGSAGSVALKQYKENVTHSFSFSDESDVPEGNYTFYGAELGFIPLQGNPYTIQTIVYAGSFYDGNRLSISFYPTARISAHLQLSGFYQINRVEFPDRDQSFTGHVARLRISAFLNTKFSLLSFVQYNSTIDKVITNFRFRYNPREGHDLYIVYDEGINTYREREVPILPVTSNRTLMIKYNYTFTLGL